MSDDPPIHIVLDEYIEANSIAELREKAADLAEAAWRRELEWQARRESMPPAPPYDPLTGSIVAGLWGNKILAEVSKRSSLLPDDEDSIG